MRDVMSEELENALLEGDVDTVRRVLEGGVDVNCWNEKGYLPMSLAVWHGHNEIVQLLLDLGADPDEDDYEGYTGMAYARWLDNDAFDEGCG